MITLSMLFCLLAKAQDTLQRKTRFPVGLYTEDNADIYGISFGVGSDTYQNSGHVGTRSNGIRIEPLSQSLLVATLIFWPDEIIYPKDPAEYPAVDSKIPNEIINGLNLSCGTIAFANVNGITISAISQSLKNTNGISITGFYSNAFRNNGIQIAPGGTGALYSNGIIASGLITAVYQGNGVQIGGFNQYVKFNGLQIGLVNDLDGKSESFTGLQIGVFNNTKKLKGFQIGLINKNGKRTLPFINWDF